MRRDKGTIINDLVDSAADIMEAKAEYLDIVAEQFEEKGEILRAAPLREEIEQILSAVRIMRELAGCWS